MNVARHTLLLGPATLLTAAFFVINLFGIFHFGMNMSADGKLTDCPFMPGMNVCPMSPAEHASFMQSLLANIPQQENPVLAFLLALSFVGAICVAWFRKLYSSTEIVAKTTHYFYRQRRLSILRVFQELFSRGILNPKPF